jgi:hypothetical protein
MRVRKLTLEALIRIVPRGCYKCRQGKFTFLTQRTDDTYLSFGSEERRKLLKEQIKRARKRAKYERPCSACIAKATTEAE